MKLPVKNIEDVKIAGVQVQLPDTADTYKETYFEWTASTLECDMKTSKISGGILRAWHHVPVFSEIETHADSEMFYFIDGTAVMLFVDLKDGKPDMSTAQVVRVKAGTQIIISAGKGHFVMVAEDSVPVQVVVVAPKMDAPRCALPEAVEGV